MSSWVREWGLAFAFACAFAYSSCLSFDGYWLSVVGFWRLPLFSVRRGDGAF
jgi:hypothetical protein